MGRLIGIDYGQKRTGLAVTDPGQLIPGSLAHVPSDKLLIFLDEYLNKEEVVGFVVGYPKQMNNQPSEAAVFVSAFIKSLQKRFPDIPVHRVDERFTSKMAMDSILMSGVPKNKRRDKGLVDEVSSVLILESFLQQREWKEKNCII